MKKEELFQVNPFNNNHIKMIQDFERENEIKTRTTDFLNKLTKEMTKEEYEKNKLNSNEIEESLFIKEAKKIKDSCHIYGEKDIKSCNISFAPIKTKLQNRRLLSLAVDYAMNILGMVDIFIKANFDDKNMIANLEAKGFESLGEENGQLIYLKEKELI